MRDQTITVEIDGDHTFELESAGDRDPVSEARAVFSAPCVIERRKDGSFTVHPVSRVTAIHIGDVPRRRVGFPAEPQQ